MMSEYLNSSPLTPPTDSNPIENVARPCWPASASSPTIRLESTPPESRQPTVDREAQRRENRVLPITFGPVGPPLAPREVGFPIRGGGTADFSLGIGLDRHQRCRWHLGHAGQNRARRRHD